MKATIGIVTQWYDPEGGSAAQPGIIARSLLKRGHEVDVVTGFPNYPSGSLSPGYRLKPYQREVIRDVTVHRAPLYPSHDTNPARRSINYLSFAAAASAVALAKLGSVEAVLVHSTPATAAIPALTLRAIRRKPFIVHIQDLWPQTVTSSGFLGEQHGGRLERTLHRFCDLVYRHAEHIAVTSPGMADLIASRGIPAKRITFLPNWSDEAAFRPALRNQELARSLEISRAFNVMYAGNLGDLQGLDVLIDVATNLRHRRDIGFVLVGSGIAEPRLRATVRERGLDNVVFANPQPFDRMAEVLALGDLQVVSLQDLPLFRRTLPSKLQATMAAGRPIIGALAGDAAKVVAASNAGVVVKPGSARQLASAIETLYSSPADRQEHSKAGRSYYRANFSEAIVGDKLSELLENAAHRTIKRK